MGHPPLPSCTHVLIHVHKCSHLTHACFHLTHAVQMSFILQSPVVAHIYPLQLQKKALAFVSNAHYLKADVGLIQWLCVSLKEVSMDMYMHMYMHVVVMCCLSSEHCATDADSAVDKRCGLCPCVGGVGAFHLHHWEGEHYLRFLHRSPSPSQPGTPQTWLLPQ